MPEDAPTVVYQRKPLSYFQFVGTEQRRRLRVGKDKYVNLSVGGSSIETDRVYLRSDSSGYRLYFDPASDIVTLSTLLSSTAGTGTDSLGQLLGTLAGRDLRFYPPEEKVPTDFD